MRRWLAAGLVAVLGMVGPVRHAPADDHPGAASDAAPSHAADLLDGRLSWTSTGPLIGPLQAQDNGIVAIKDPSVVHHDGRWHVYATTANEQGHWGMVYLSFADWSEAASAEQVPMDRNPALRGYHCAPQVFYFAPQQKWYLIYQSQHPQFSTTDDISRPETWSAPQDFFDGKPDIVGDLWLDYWVICDDAHAYLFFTGDDGRFYRSRTTLEQFPKGMSDPVVVMEEENRFHLFEGSATYRIKGTDTYLTIIEALGPRGQRYYRSFVADRLDGAWTPLADSWERPFAGMSNVTFADGVEPWTQDVSHGELIRDGSDQTMTVDPANLRMLYQGMLPPAGQVPYSQLPYRLGLLRLSARPEAP